MNIVHISPCASFTDGWSYQENLLPKYQQKLGHNVTLIVVNKSRPNQTLIEVPCKEFESMDGFRVITKAIKELKPKQLTSLFSIMDVYDELIRLKPDMIFFHGLVSATVNQAVKYKKAVNKDLIIVQDNHLDFNIGIDPSKNMKTRFQCWIYRSMYRMNSRYISKVYGVTPWRKQYAIEVFGTEEEKTDVLIMGADDEKIDLSQKERIRKQIRMQYDIKEETFLIVTGGKIDKKKKIDNLMKACEQLEDVQLLVFGNVLDDVSEEFQNVLNRSSNIKYIGWVDAEKTYDLYFAADLVVFPGQHSVMWEQACASKTPCLFGKWNGMDHVDNGGNCDFISNCSPEGIREKVNEYLFTEKYDAMKKVANSEKTDIFLYSRIAEKSLECAKKC